MRRDENVFMMGEDIGLYCGAFGVSRGMIQEFGGDRIMDTPIAEQAYVAPGWAPPCAECAPSWS